MNRKSLKKLGAAAAVFVFIGLGIYSFAPAPSASQKSQGRFYNLYLGMESYEFFKIIPKLQCSDITESLGMADIYAGMTKWKCRPESTVIERVEVTFYQGTAYLLDFIFSGGRRELNQTHHSILAKFEEKLQPLNGFGTWNEHKLVLGSCASWTGGKDCVTRRWLVKNDFAVLYSHVNEYAAGLRIIESNDKVLNEIHSLQSEYDTKKLDKNRKSAL